MERPFSSVPGRAACALREDDVVSKNTNELRTGVPWAFRMRGIYAWLAMGARMRGLLGSAYHRASAGSADLCEF